MFIIKIPIKILWIGLVRFGAHTILANDQFERIFKSNERRISRMLTIYQLLAMVDLIYMLAFKMTRQFVTSHSSASNWKKRRIFSGSISPQGKIDAWHSAYVMFFFLLAGSSFFWHRKITFAPLELIRLL